MQYMPKFLGVWMFFLVLVSFQSTWGQVSPTDTTKKNEEELIKPDTTRKLARDSVEVRLGDTTRNDTNRRRTPQAKGDIKTTIKYDARDSVMLDITGQIMYLYGEAKVVYGDTKLDAAYIEVNMKTNLITAKAVKDSSGKVVGRPVFSDNAGSYEADSMIYNYKTRKGIINRVVTKQGDGFIVLQKAKKNEKNETFGLNGYFTTCNLAKPHFHIKSYKLKLIPEKQIVTGPFNLYVNDAPTPLGFLFGIFPFTNRNTSGIIIPTYGEERERGFFFRQGGYYWAVSPYVGITFLSDFYTNGSWGVSMRTEYRKRYRFSGRASLAFNKNITGDELNRATSEDFWVTWNHAPIPRGTSRFSASVRAGSSRFNANNTFQTQNRLSNNFTSNISYSNTYTIGDVQFNLGLNARHNQNVQTGIMNMDLPDVSLQMARFFPFKKPGKPAKNAFQNLSLTYTLTSKVTLTNTPLATSTTFVPRSGETASDSIDFNPSNLPELVRRGGFGIRHSIPLSTNFKLLKYINVTPSISYEEWWYPQQLQYEYDPTREVVLVDTLNGFARGYSYRTSIAFNTRIYGLFQKIRFLGKNVEGIRHIMNPSVNFSYSPDFQEERFGSFQTVQTAANTDPVPVSRFQGTSFIFGGPSGAASAVMGFSLSNTFEMKVKNTKDTTGKNPSKKIKLLENLSFAGSYNFLADSFNLSRISINARTRLLEFIDLNVTGSYNPYTWELISNEGGTIVQQQRDVFGWNRDLNITNPTIGGQLSNASIALGANFTPQAFRKRRQEKINKLQNAAQNTELRQRQIMNDPNSYVDFDIPWRLNINFNMAYNKNGFQKSVVTRTLNFNGDVSITKTWKVSVTSGYDFEAKNLSYTTLDIYKDLHCWEMRFSWIPFGQFQSFSFDLKVKAAILQDLKLSRRRSWFDR
ncbi:MAG TPA: hypothetical protein DCS93_33995 [Microscillaceae bacterium]|nr:hypothetical protein [Microscillaceae bacterium]